MTSPISLRVFVSSPRDVSPERAQTQQVLSELAGAYRKYVQLETVFWEHEPLFGHAGFQEQIERPSQCDLVITLLWSRMGLRLPASFAAEPGKAAPTGTEFEIRDALESYERLKRPNLLIYLKTKKPSFGDDADEAERRIAQKRALDRFVKEAFYAADGTARVAHHVFEDPAQFVSMLRTHVEKWLLDQLAKQHVEGAQRVWTKGSPFRGLQVFEAEHRDIYFGRTAAISAVLELIQAREVALQQGNAGNLVRCLVLQGLSGNGKSSLIRAGVLPLLESRALEGVGLTRQAVMRPGSTSGNVFMALVEALQQALPELGQDDEAARQKLASDLSQGAAGAAMSIRIVVGQIAKAQQIQPEYVRVVLVVDQLEELFADPTLTAQAQDFGRALLSLAQSGQVWVIATLRSDFAHHLERDDTWRRIGQGAVFYTLQKPDEDELAEMIREPARVAGVRYEERTGIGLDRQMLLDAKGNAESLPLVEFVLDELWKRHDAGPTRHGVLTYSDYEQLGGLAGALTQRAEETFAASVQGTDEERESCFRTVMRQLVVIGEDKTAVRRRAALAEFDEGSLERRFIDALIKARLCVTDVESKTQVPVVMVAHEALLTQWKRANEWFALERDLLAKRNDLEQRYTDWSDNGRPDSLLLSRGLPLNRALEVRAAGITLKDDQARYLDASVVTEQALLANETRRRRRIVQASVATAVLSLILTSMAVWGWKSARARAAELEQVSKFQADMLGQVDPTEAGKLLSKDVKARFNEALSKTGVSEGDRAAQVEVFAKQWQLVNATDAARDLIDSTILKPAVAAIDKQFKDQPVVDAALRQVLAVRYREMGLYDAAMPLQERALNTRRRALGEDHPDTLESINYMGRVLQSQDKGSEAEPYYREALVRRRRVLGEDHPDTLESISNFGRLMMTQGKWSEAEPYFREALEKRRHVLGEDHPDTLTSINIMGYMLKAQGKLSEAEPYLRETLEKSRRVLGEEDRYTLIAISNLGALLEDQGKLSEAEPFDSEALEKGRRVLGEESPLTLIFIRYLGTLLKDEGRLGEAEPLLREALVKRRRAFGEENRNTLESIDDMGSLRVNQGKYAEAVELLSPAEAPFRKGFIGSYAYRLSRFLMNLGNARTGLRQYAVAEAYLLEAHGILVQSPGPVPKDMRDCTQAIVDLYTAWNAKEPGKGYDTKAAEWKQKLDELSAASPAPIAAKPAPTGRQ